MRTQNLTPFLFGAMATSLRPPRPAVTLIVKGTFVLRPGEPVVPLEGVGAQGSLRGDVFAPSDDDRRGPLLYPSDFADFKPRADVLVRAACHTPGGKPLAECPVRVAAGAWSKAVRVVGPRVWVPGTFGDTPSDPLPFTSMPLDDTRAFGGPGDPRNPAGKGLGTDELHQIEAPRDVVRARGDRIAPEGLGPVSPFWQDRWSKVGKEYGERWRKTRAPYVAEDFDWSFFNAARADQQIEGYLRGDEELSFQNLHPAAALFSVRLPGLRIRAFLKDDIGRFRAVPMRLDTLIADLHDERLTLVWRGVDEVREHDLADVKTALIAAEPLPSAPGPEDDYRAKLEAFEADPLGLRDATWPIAPGAVDSGAGDAASGAGDAASGAGDVEATGDPLWSLLRPRLARLPREHQNRVRGTLDRLTDGPPGGRELKEALIRALSAAPAAPPPVVMPRKPGEPPYVPLGQELRQIRRFIERLEATLRQQLSSADGRGERPLDRSFLAKLEALEKDPYLRSLDPYFRPQDGEPPEPGPGVDLSGHDLSERDLSGRDLSGADLRGALLRKANLRGARLRGARLKHAILYEADLSGADLSEVDATLAHFGSARARGAALRGARLDQAVLEAADLAEADLSGISGEYTTLSRADLSGANARGARLERALIEAATLRRADFGGAEILRSRITDCEASGARFEGLVLDTTSFAGSRLDGASFVEARGEGAIFRGADLTGADLQYAALPGAFFDEARLDRAHLSAADLPRARLYRASLEGAEARQANLLEADLRRANLSRATFEGANLFGARMRHSHRAGCDFSGANLKRVIFDEQGGG